MSESKSSTRSHTPGPWKLVATDDGWEIHMGSRIGAFNHWEPQHEVTLDWGDTYEYEGDNSQFQEAEANAYLIAAAPDLKDVVKWAVEWMAACEGEVMPGWREWAERARAALAAAQPAATSEGAP